MRIAPRIFGFWFAAGAMLLAGAPTKEVQLTAPPRKDSPSLADKKKESPSPPVMIGNSARRGLEDTVEILTVKEEKPDATGNRKVTVRVRYALVHYAKGVLSLGFNLKTATRFVSVTNKPLDAGAEDIDLSAMVVPVTWPKGEPFKLYVSLSGEVRSNQWSLLAAEARAMKPTAPPAAAKSALPAEAAKGDEAKQ